jgi:hypothetical protein
MKKHLVIVPLLFAALAAPRALEADQQYNVNLTVGSETVTGTIVTDGNMGTLSFEDINSFSFGVSQAGSSSGSAGGTVKGAGKGDIAESGDAVTATSAGLFFDFNATDPSSLKFLDAGDNFLLCLFTDEVCDPPEAAKCSPSAATLSRYRICPAIRCLLRRLQLPHPNRALLASC